MQDVLIVKRNPLWLRIYRQGRRPLGVAYNKEDFFVGSCRELALVRGLGLRSFLAMGSWDQTSPVPSDRHTLLVCLRFSFVLYIGLYGSNADAAPGFSSQAKLESASGTRGRQRAHQSSRNYGEFLVRIIDKSVGFCYSIKLCGRQMKVVHPAFGQLQTHRVHGKRQVDYSACGSLQEAHGQPPELAATEILVYCSPPWIPACMLGSSSLFNIHHS